MPPSAVVVAEALQDSTPGKLKMVLCMAAYLALILLTWTYLGEDGWPDFQLRTHFSRMIDTILSTVGSWQRSPDAGCLAGTFLALTLSPFGHIQAEDGFPLPRLNSEGMP